MKALEEEELAGVVFEQVNEEVVKDKLRQPGWGEALTIDMQQVEADKELDMDIIIKKAIKITPKNGDIIEADPFSAWPYPEK